MRTTALRRGGGEILVLVCESVGEGATKNRSVGHRIAMVQLAQYSGLASSRTGTSAPIRRTGSGGVVPHRVSTLLTTMSGSKRTFFGSYYNHNHLPEPEEFVTPMESILMDCTAWFVAFALIYVPSVSTPSPLDDDDNKDNYKNVEKEAERERRRRRRGNEQRGTTRQKDDSVDS